MNTTHTLLDWIRRLQRITLDAGAPPVCRTVAEEIRQRFAPGARIGRGGGAPQTGRHAATLRIAVDPATGGRLRFGVDRDGAGVLAAPDAHHLYAWFCYLVDCRGGEPLAAVSRGRSARPAFRWQRPIFDFYFTQSGRTVRGLDRETYVRQMARFGFTHLEVNGLATPEPIEPGVPGEVYPRFYTYCPALDQFVSSFLNRGFYPADYLAANLRRLEHDARLAVRYGLVPVLLCFEPRSVPDALLAKYPELRGARVDHPFRSFRPRYNLAVSHPVVRRHYREMIQTLLRAVPELGCLAIWSNDSGAGFEFTRTLYVGANGSAYLVREWSEEDVFARAAAGNAVGFLRLLQESAAEINPDFRVTTRLEPFGPERAHVLRGVGVGLDVEVPTLLATGWDSPYRHPRYADSDIGALTIFNNRFLPAERAPMRALARCECRTHVMHAHGPVNNFEPLLGIPAPWLTHEKLAALHAVGADYLAHLGGIAPPGAVRWNVNEEVFRRFQFAPERGADETVEAIARAWAAPPLARTLVGAWRLVDRAIRGFMPNPLYFQWGPWYRLWVRPLVPDIERIPERERAYYERHLLSTHHNPNRVDLSRDVLFHLMTPALARKTAARIERNALPPLDRAIARLEAAAPPAGTEGAALLRDQLDRLRALRCWFVTRQSVAVWIGEVHGYLRSRSAPARATARARLRAMAAREITNAERLLALWRESPTVFMAVSAGQETTFLYDRNFGRHLERKIRLMRQYGNARPRIDSDIIWRVANLRAPAARRAPR